MNEEEKIYSKTTVIGRTACILSKKVGSKVYEKNNGNVNEAADSLINIVMAEKDIRENFQAEGDVSKGRLDSTHNIGVD